MKVRMPHLSQSRQLAICLLVACFSYGVIAGDLVAAPRPKTWSDFSAGPEPKGLAFDGTDLWVTNSVAQGTVTRLRAQDGVVLGRYPVGAYPTGIAYDGTHLWVANSMDRKVTRLSALDGTVRGAYPVGEQPPCCALRRPAYLGEQPPGGQRHQIPGPGR